MEHAPYRQLHSLSPLVKKRPIYTLHKPHYEEHDNVPYPANARWLSVHFVAPAERRTLLMFQIPHRPPVLQRFEDCYEHCAITARITVHRVQIIWKAAPPHRARCRMTMP
jgi:hypothetical protein